MQFHPSKVKTIILVLDSITLTWCNGFSLWVLFSFLSLKIPQSFTEVQGSRRLILYPCRWGGGVRPPSQQRRELSLIVLWIWSTCPPGSARPRQQTVHTSVGWLWVTGDSRLFYQSCSPSPEPTRTHVDTLLHAHSLLACVDFAAAVRFLFIPAKPL